MTTPSNWLGGKLARDHGDGYLGGLMGQWICMRCGRNAPYSAWRAIVGISTQPEPKGGKP